MLETAFSNCEILYLLEMLLNFSISGFCQILSQLWSGRQEGLRSDSCISMHSYSLYKNIKFVLLQKNQDCMKAWSNLEKVGFVLADDLLDMCVFMNVSVCACK